MYSYVPVDFYKIEDRLSTCIQLAWLNKNKNFKLKIGPYSFKIQHH